MTATLVKSPGILTAPGAEDMIYDSMVQISCGCSACAGTRVKSKEHGLGFRPCSAKHMPIMERARLRSMDELNNPQGQSPAVFLVPLMQAVEDRFRELQIL